MKLVFPKIYSFPQYLLVGVFLLELGSKVESFSSSGSGNFLTFTLALKQRRLIVTTLSTRGDKKDGLRQGQE